MSLSLADKLALMLTSAPSQRALAAYIGASHQQVGRWLQGERINPDTGAITNLPRDPAIVANINTAFAQYRSAVRAQARRDGIPYDREVPVAFHRLDTFRGAPSLRVVAERLEHLRPDLFDRVIYGQVASGHYYEVSVRSTIDLAAYIQRGDERYGTPMQRARKIRSGRVAATMLKHRANLMHKLQEGRLLCPIWTKRENAMPGVDPATTLTNLHAKLRQKHEPATTLPGTKLADQVMLSLLPANHAQHPAQARARQKQKARKARNHIRGRGPK